MRLEILSVMLGYLLINLVWFGDDALYLLLGLLLFIWGLIELWHEYDRKCFKRLLWLLPAGFLLFGIRVLGGEFVVQDTVLNLDDGVYQLSGYICREPDIRREAINYVLCVETASKENGVSFEIEGRVKIKEPFYQTWKYGQDLVLVGELKTPENFANFNYQKFLASQRIDKEFTVQKIKNDLGIRSGKLNWLFNLKAFSLERFSRLFHEPAASLIAGLQVGYRGGFADSELEKLNRTGLTHLIAISGSNVALILLLLERFFAFLPKYWRLSFLIIGVILFMIFTGLSSAVIRATIMGTLMLLSRYVGKEVNILFILIVTLFALSLWNPLLLVFDIGLHLSVLAVLGIVVFGNVCDELLFKISVFKKLSLIRESIVLTISAQIFVLPILVKEFGVISLHAPFMNAAVSPLLVFIITISALAFCFGGLPFGWVLIVLADFVCRVFLKIADFGSDQLGFFVWEISEVSREKVGLILVLFVAYVLGLFRLRSTKNLEERLLAA